MIENRIVATGEADPADLLANPKNWRQHPEEQRAALEAVLREVGWVQNVVVNQRTGRLIDGHLRVALAKQRREPLVPVCYVDLDEEEEAKILATIDPVAGMAGTDQELLDRLLAEVTTDDPALQDLLDSLAGEPEADVEDDEEADEDELPEPPRRLVTELGDVWTLGDHRLVCGDSTAEAGLSELIRPDESRADMVFTDPPYAIYGSSTGIAADITDDKMVRPFFRDVVANVVAILKPFGHAYICCDWRSWASWWEVAKGTGLTPKNMVVWDKGGGLGGMYANAHELILFASNRPMREGMSQKITGERTVAGSNIWRVNRAGRDETGEKRQHNAQKPLELMQTAIRNSTDPGDVVVDFFGGSGSTLMACEKTQRACRMMEIDPRWCDLIITRWQKATGEQATDQNGRTFDERAAAA